LQFLIRQLEFSTEEIWLLKISIFAYKLPQNGAFSASFNNIINILTIEKN